MSNEKDPWIEALSRKIEKIDSHVWKEFEEWTAAKKTPEIRIAADNFDSEKIIRSIEKSCAEISRWYIQEHNKLIKSVCREVEIKPSPWLLNKDDNWISNGLFSEKRKLETAVNRIKKEMQNTALYLEKNTGFFAGMKQFLDGAIKGYISPLRAFYDVGKDLIGGVEDPKAQKIEKDFDSAFENLKDALKDFDDAIYAKCVSRWNDKTLGAIKDIENSLLPSKAMHQPSLFKRCFFGIVKIAFLAALILAGYVLLKNYGIF